MMRRKSLAGLGLAVALALGVTCSPCRLLAAPSTAPSANQDAQPATPSDLLEQGTGQLQAGEFAKSLATLQRIDTHSLSSDDRIKLDGALTKADAGLTQQQAATSELKLGDASRLRNDMAGAEQHYSAAVNNPDVDSQTKQLASAHLSDVRAATAGASSDSITAYNKAVDEFKKHDLAAAKTDFTNAQKLGFNGGLAQASCDEYLQAIDKQQNGDVKSKDTAAQGQEAYEKAKDEYRSGQYDAARNDFAQARDLNYVPDFTKGLTPTEYLARLDELQTPAKSGATAMVSGSASAAGQTVNLADDAGSQPASGSGNAQDLQLRADMDRIAASQNVYRAQGLVDSGKKAEATGNNSEALRDYQQAQQLDATNKDATSGISRVQGKLGVSNGGAAVTAAASSTGTGAADQERAMQAEMQAIQLKFKQALDDSRSDMTKTDFDAARNDIASAQADRDENPALFNSAQLNQMDAAIAAAKADLNNAVNNIKRQNSINAIKQATSIEQQRLNAEREQRRATVQALVKLAQTDVNQQDFEAALGVLDQITQLDPQNDYAVGVRQFVEDKAVEREQRNDRETGDFNTERQLNHADEKLIPYDDLYRYPDNWPNISEMRDNEIQNTGVSKEDQQVQAELDRRLPVSLPQVPFTDAVQFLQDASGANILVNWKALETAQIDRQTPVTASLHDVKLSKVLQIVLDQVGEGKLGYTIDDGVIMISTKDELNKAVVTKVYDIGDLLINPNFNSQIQTGALQFSNTGTTGSGATGGGGGGGGGAGGAGGGGIFGQGNQQNGQNGTMGNQQQLTDIENKIQNTVAFPTWKKNDPNGYGQIDDFNNELIITQTSDVHGQIQGLLDQLRETRAIEVNIEVRFLTVSRNYLDDVGVALNFPSVGLGNSHFTAMSITDNSGQFTSFPTTGVPGSIGSAAANAQSTLSLGYSDSGVLDNLSVTLLIRAIQASKYGSIVESPRVTLHNGQGATMIQETEIPYVATLTASVAAGATIATPVIQNATNGVQLLIDRAVVSADRKYVTLDMTPTLDQLNGFQSFTFETASAPAASVGAGGITIAPTQAPTLTIQEPSETITEVRTRVTVPDGGTLLLGGLTIAGETDEEAGVPILSKIPFLKTLSSNHSMAKDEQILILLVKPTIIIDKEIEAKNFPILSAGRQ